MSNSTSADAPSSDNNDSPPSTSPPPPSEEDSSPPPPPKSDTPSPPPPSESAPAPSSKESSRPPPSKESSRSQSPPSPTDKFSPSPPQGKTKPPALEPPPLKNDDASPSRQRKSPSNDDSRSDLQLPIIIGVVAGVAVFVLIILISAVICCCKKKKKHKMHYYDPGEKGNNYYNNGGGGFPPKWQTQPTDHNVKIPPPPGNLGVSPGGGGWPTPPPPVVMSSSDMSSTFSGSHGAPMPPPSPGIALGFNKSTFTYEELLTATGGFSQANLLGQGGFGYVYKGYLPNGKEVAVKQLKAGSGQGEREFQAEVEIISRVHHRHLVSLVGYCIAGEQRLLVYEFVPNNTLEHHLHGKGLPPMEWPTRVKIAIGSAKGFAYLHEDCHPRIIHRDIKASNILLDYKFEAMVADFGLAKLSSDNYTHVSTRIMGTFGYLAPEYASSGKLTDKSDVFSFGVMLLELITGRRPIDHTCMDDSLVDWARPILTEALAEGKFDELADPRLEGNYNTMEMAHMVSCAAACVRHSARRRPKMSQVVRALEGESSLDDLNDGVKPGQSMYFSSSSEHEPTSYSSKMRQFRKMALGTTDEYSGNYTGVTSEYGLNPSESSSSSGEYSNGRRPHPQL